MKQAQLINGNFAENVWKLLKTHSVFLISYIINEFKKIYTTLKKCLLNKEKLSNLKINFEEQSKIQNYRADVSKINSVEHLLNLLIIYIKKLILKGNFTLFLDIGLLPYKWGLAISIRAILGEKKIIDAFWTNHVLLNRVLST